VSGDWPYGQQCPLMSKAGHALTYINITVGGTWYVK